MADPNMLGPSTLAITQGIGAFSAFLPKLSEVRRADPVANPDIAADVRMGEVAAVALTVGVGVMVSSFTGSNAPVYTAVFVSLSLVMIYESALRGDRPFERKEVTE
jgi:hypothetical protein